jgi:hypothetical protein
MPHQQRIVVLESFPPHSRGQRQRFRHVFRLHISTDRRCASAADRLREIAQAPIRALGSFRIHRSQSKVCAGRFDQSQNGFLSASSEDDVRKPPNFCRFCEGDRVSCPAEISRLRLNRCAIKHLHLNSCWFQRTTSYNKTWLCQCSCTQ